MSKILIGFSDTKKWMPFSWLIKCYAGQAYSHAYIGYFDSVTSQEMIAESSHGEFHKITRENWLKKNNVIEEYEIALSSDLYYVIMRHINNNLQIDYSILNIFGVPFYDLYEKTGLKIFKVIAKWFIDGQAAIICSEAAGFTLALLGVQFTRPFDFLRPDHIQKAVIAYKVKNG
jgi:hypothetical protein